MIVRAYDWPKCKPLLPHSVTLVKSDGRRFTHIPASVHDSEIWIGDSSIPLEVGDKLERATTDGRGERRDTYVVLDPGYRDDWFSLPPAFVAKVRKEA